ncbi:TMEM175 family protein [Furfurilactobacillus siliginis]|uniref:Membrane protein n=1 Tax=Furfurilactobacillus siliginis TaxID=348151 RepID=A0A0R2L5U9_9LACO|nr:TMEM175 family protein [Furfurilactobacillus siliginis]KRN97134.1 hypothetical protein IV55_GL000051 [Furfurilactobacillus siliginis]GEK29500.1 membrane protein [Furfurilactobacillus siliginis]
MVQKSRLEAYSDAILAIIITIMILEIHVPKLGRLSLLFENRSYLFAYTVGFVLITAVWYNHSHAFDPVSKLSPKSYLANALWLFLISFLPVMTNWVGAHLNERGPEYTYFIWYLLWLGSWVLLLTMLQGDLRREHKPAPVPGFHFKLVFSPIFLALTLANLIAMYWLPVLGILFVLGSVFYATFQSEQRIVH